MTSSELYVKGARVWIPNVDFVWEGAILEKDYKQHDTIVYVTTDKGEKREIKINAEKDLPHLRNPAILIGQNDLTALSYLHEPDVLYNLEVRFKERQVIYTYCGIVLVALNPYQDLPIYGSDIIRAYRGHAIGELEPHIFAVSEEAYAELEREKSNISIIVSGESGAGKTVSAKYAMRYFAAVGGSESETQIERKVLASSPIMEAIGNAKTTRNDNSSRFGKFTKLLFQNEASMMSLTGATMQTYLLEKSRVVFQAPGERNYHIFYQICAGRNKYPELMLEHQDKFKFLNQGESPDIAKVSDEKEFDETLDALTTLGFSNDEINSIVRILAGILHLGNINITHRTGGNHEEDYESCSIASNDLSLNIVSDILRLDKDDLLQWLTTRQIESINDTVMIPMNKSSAEGARDALAKHLYSKLFHFIVQTVNRNLMSGKNEDSFIGVLDIYGFETFDINSFEQFSINYANEKLQQQFNQHVFKLEQEVYLKEGIVWTMIDFYDNQPCIDLIESKLGILDLLDEECRMPNGSDSSWVGKLNEKCKKYKHFDKTRFGTGAFLVKHFSDTVQYECQGFLEKNRDTVSKELVSVVQYSGMDFCRRLMLLDEKEDKTSEKEKSATVPGRGVKVVVSASKLQTLPSKQHKQTVGHQFRESLNQLITTLHSTTPHYVHEDRYRLGHTQIFFRAGQVAYLEQLRSDLRRKYVIKIQSVIRGFICRRRYLKLRRTALGLQAHARGMFARRKAKEMRENRAAIQIQRFMKGWYRRRLYLKAKRSVVAIQRYGRGYLARKRFTNVLQHHKATEIQRYCRGYLARKSYNRKIRNIVIVQSCVRRFLAKKKLKKLKEEARSITHLQTKYKGLENKIIQLQQKFDATNKENIALKSQIAVIPELRAKVEVFKNIENELRTVKMNLSEKEDQLISVQKKLDRERDEKMAIIEEKTKDDEEWLIEKNQWQIERQEMKKQLNEMIETSKNEKNASLSEVETNEINQAYQKLVKQKVSLDHENAQLKKEIKRLQMIISSPQEIDQLKHPIIIGDEDFGYSSSRNTLEKNHKSSNASSSQFSEEHVTSTSNSSPIQNQDTTVLMLRLRKLLEEEKMKGDSLRNEVEWLKRKSSNMTLNTVDSLKISELEVENAKLRQDYQLLRNSVIRGVEQQELESQYKSVVEESLRRRDECIQLKSALSQQLRQFASQPDSKDVSMRSYEGNDLNEAFQAQKLANKQLEMELTALTEEHNMKLTEMMKEIDNLRNEKCMLEIIIQDKLDIDVDDVEIGHQPASARQKECYLRLEVERTSSAYVDTQEKLNTAKRQIKQLEEQISILTNRLRENGLVDSMILNNSDVNGDVVTVLKKKAQSYQGILKHQYSNEKKILQRLVTDLTPRIAITLLPNLPAYILFMCIRYTDLLNADDQVKTLLTNFILSVKKLFKLPNKVETRILWIVNSITLHNLLKQYGGDEDYMQFNTDLQNQQQLKNFDLSEYRQVIYDAIIYMYETLIKQIQESIRPLIVPAILYHDETARGKSRRVMATDSPGTTNGVLQEPQSLVNHLEHYYKQFIFFGLHDCYIEQIFQQLFYFICAIALNNLMLRSDLCTWKTGMKLRFNVGCLESWVKQKKMPKTVISPSMSLTEAALLMQSRKSDADVDSIVEICPSLMPSQIMKLIKSYSLDDCEDPISSKFIEKLSKKLNASEKASFTLNENEIRPLSVGFNYLDVKLEDIDIPDVLKLNGLVTKI
ncbi:CLUMA_CG015744, isoform B [Clunio marinus]|uniref:CLUMA_CG015744, isoform B n=1 Tax=Clunio marinus TaxID=568069 RepID=A0A1J1IRG9_9DIPT|nr:CLUMA_CG015744, isoform B [Clunio marinus]